MADQALNLTLKDAYVDRVKAALNFFAGHEMSVVDKDVKYRFKYTYLPKQDGENNKQFYERFLKEALRAFVRCYELGADRGRAISQVDAVAPPCQSVPDGIVE